MSVTGATSATSTFITDGSDSLLSFGDGGVTDKPSIAGEDGEEVVIPVEKNMDNSYNLLAYAAKKLGTSSPVTATVSESTAKKSSELAVSGTQQNSQHLDKLDAQIELMQRQNEMLLYKPSQEWKFCTSPTDSKVYGAGFNGTRLVDKRQFIQRHMEEVVE